MSGDDSTPILAGARPSPNVGVPSTPEERAVRRSAALRAAREALAAAPRQQPTTLHAYGPHDPSTAPQREKVHLPVGGKWPTLVEDDIHRWVKQQREALNRIAHEQALRRLHTTD